MRICLFLLSLLFLFGCAEERPLQFHQEVTDVQDCGNCPMVYLELHRASGKAKLADVINQAVEEELITLLHFREDRPVRNLEEAIASFSGTPGELPLESTQWEAEVKTRITHQDEDLLTLAMTSYLYTGGAHGYGQTRYLNFDTRRGQELQAWELFRNSREFEEFAERAFRKAQQIPADASINATGFMFEGGEFYLPENIGLTPEGLVLHYNQYEIASYAEGPVILVLPYEQVRQYLIGQ